MTIPDFETAMKPLLLHLADGQDHGTDETLNALAKEFRLTDEERRQLLPSGRQALFRNRVAWAKFYLKKAGVVGTSRRGVYHITERGRTLLQSCDDRIDVSVLQQFQEFREFLLGGRRSADGEEQPSSSPTSSPSPVEHLLLAVARHYSNYTPEELVAFGHEQLTAQLSAELLDRIKAASPEFFEQLVVELLLALGYGGSRQDAGQIVGRSGDEGIDGVIKEDRLGLDTIYVQAKRWEGTVGRPEIQKFAGALQGQRARKGIFITSSSFTKEAYAFASSIESKISLVDGAMLTRLMIEHSVGVTKVASYDIQRIDSDYFVEE
jgi:restriction system protein